MKRRQAKHSWFAGATSATILGHRVKAEGPQVSSAVHAHGDSECCIEIDDNVVFYQLGPNGVHSHSYMHRDFATPWELAEALIRDFGALAVRGGRSADAPPHDHGAGHDLEHGGAHGPGKQPKVSSRRKKGGHRA